ncbi:MAG: hypothetical protein HWN67_01505 [Candidatus Helarchaeota archaeon]|nr:hypothetical protein [Candidatus Helarchaeota archaeon]
MVTQNQKVVCPIFIGIMIIFQGIFLAFVIPPDYSGWRFSEFSIIGIVEICAGSVLIIIGIINSIMEGRGFDKFARVASESSRSEERIESTISSSRTELSSLTCPKCGAPIKSDPPCSCDYCGVLIR